MPKGVYPRPKPRGNTRLAAQERQLPVPSALESACRTFEAEVGGRLRLIEHLVHAPLTDDQSLLVGAIADPRNDAVSLARICYSFGIQFSDLLTLFRSAGFVRAQLAAMQKVWSRLGEVAGDIMDRSVPHALPCVECAGTGTRIRTRQEAAAAAGTGGAPKVVRWEEQCEACDGRGEIQHQPSLDVQKVALELGGLLQRPGMQVNLTQQQAIVAPGAMGDFWAASDKAIFLPSAPPVPPADDEVAPPAEDDEVDAEVVDAEDEGPAET